MKRKDCYVGQGVIYQPHPSAAKEEGVVTEMRDYHAMVRYSALGSAKATYYVDLHPIAGEPS